MSMSLYAQIKCTCLPGCKMKLKCHKNQTNQIHQHSWGSIRVSSNDRIPPIRRRKSFVTNIFYRDFWAIITVILVLLLLLLLLLLLFCCCCLVFFQQNCSQRRRRNPTWVSSEFTQQEGRKKRTAKRLSVTNVTALFLACFVGNSLNTDVFCSSTKISD